MILPVFGKRMKVAIGLMALWVAFLVPCKAAARQGSEVRAVELSPRLHEGEFFSASLQKKAKYRVLLPQKYATDGSGSRCFFCCTDFTAITRIGAS
jgi:hypothetical protein